MATVEQIQLKVQKMLQKTGSVTVNQDGTITFDFGSSAVVLNCVDWGDGDVLIDASAAVAFNVPYSDELCADLLLNRRMDMGAWMVYKHEDNPKLCNVFFDVRILGNDVDERELMLAIQCAGQSGDQHDDQIVARFGGERVEDIRQS